MSNRFLRIVRKQPKQKPVGDWKPYQRMSHQEYVDELDYLFTCAGFPQMKTASLDTFVVTVTTTKVA